MQSPRTQAPVYRSEGLLLRITLSVQGKILRSARMAKHLGGTRKEVHRVQKDLDHTEHSSSGQKGGVKLANIFH